NADEGDPGAFMDRAILEGDPHSVLEAMTIAGFAVGANKGYIYVRAEYPVAVKNLEIAIKQSREKGFIGRNILDTEFCFDIELRLGAGAFVCGEETALLASIEGGRGEPMPKPPFPATSGLFKKPTLINNVETLTVIPMIILRGAKYWNTTGTKTSKGTKVFALAGNIANGGLVEVPMGTTLKTLIYDIGGGAPATRIKKKTLNGETGEIIEIPRTVKAVQVGGPSGGCIPASMFDVKLDYESLRAAGAMLGSGGLIVADDKTCMVNMAKFFIKLSVDESCGKCTPCRIGNTRLYEILDRISKGQGKETDIQELRDLGNTIKNSSLCGLGMSAPNPVLSTIDRFLDEYEAHVLHKKCPAGACKDLVEYFIIPEKCIGCTLCKRVCPVDCIAGELKKPHVIDQSKCIKCGACVEKCKPKAIITQ
ncbi:MAG: 4Fe-4S binding protein, partial [Defluviitaleaceae bacterium]|nr:4Fe-4S binding protein [Defluviitaleaceae bacterium]